MFKRLYLRWAAHVAMVECYLAYHRDEKLLAAEYENDANRYKSELRRLEILGL